ncbi:MAG TPA: hypothetical protein P5558_16675 [Geminicoccaceae bacterium]|jgi:hypothetical protein|nr:hypothetical protein [Geminicoccaceae bacterium]
MIALAMVDSLEPPADPAELDAVLRRAMRLAELVMATTDEATADDPFGRMVLGLALQRCLAGFYARMALDHEASELAPEIAGRAVRIAMEATAELAERLVAAGQHMPAPPP